MTTLPTYQQIKDKLPSTSSQSNFVKEIRNQIRSILNSHSSQLLLIVGPCSIHNLDQALEYAEQINSLQQEVSNYFLLLMRTYFEKPRTTFGWKGFLYDPYLDSSHQMHEGIEKSRQLLLDLASMGVATATEFLDPLSAFYYEDLISWGSIGARTSSSQTHRQLASSLSMPVGFKNGVAGNISAAIQGVRAAAISQTYMGLDADGKTVIKHSRGNPDCHIVLRGGERGPNYDQASVAWSLKALQEQSLPARLIIDCSHHNSSKQHDRQPAIFHSILQQVIQGNPFIKGIMLESHLREGSQQLEGDPKTLKYGVSITDACLDWPATRRLILEGAERLKTELALPKEDDASILFAVR